MKVGDYVRTKKGIIGKYTEKEVEERIPDWTNGGYKGGKVLKRYINDIEYSNFNGDEIIKFSPNLLDLIEVGDYVNGKLVKDINPEKTFIIVETSSIIQDTIYKEDIKSIVTKEMFERVEYKV